LSVPEFDIALYSKHPKLQTYESILLAYRGSIAHGTYEPNTDPNSIDDLDLMGISVPDIEHYFGLRQFGSRGTVEIVDDPWDIVLYEARKAIGLLAKSNPNILSLLWLPEHLYIHVEPAGRLLIEARDLFATRTAFQPFVGYAKGQLHKMERGAFKGYMGEKRRALVERHGYDTKNAAHLIRILRMGIEFLRDGEMHVEREDAAELLAIKHGEWSLEEVKASANFLFGVAEEAHAASTLPDAPDFDAINVLCADVISEAAGVG
jgi:predicted nucleotidyltransferase